MIEMILCWGGLVLDFLPGCLLRYAPCECAGNTWALRRSDSAEGVDGSGRCFVTGGSEITMNTKSEGSLYSTRLYTIGEERMTGHGRMKPNQQGTRHKKQETKDLIYLHLDPQLYTIPPQTLASPATIKS
jgi:hypothetical protein